MISRCIPVYLALINGIPVDSQKKCLVVFVSEFHIESTSNLAGAKLQVTLQGQEAGTEMFSSVIAAWQGVFSPCCWEAMAQEKLEPRFNMTLTDKTW